MSLLPIGVNFQPLGNYQKFFIGIIILLYFEICKEVESRTTMSVGTHQSDEPGIHD